VYEVGAEGPLFALPGGDARLAVGGGYRINKFQQYNYLNDTSLIEGQESSRFAYAELNLPLVGFASGGAGMRQLELTAAARREDYDSFGSVVTPKIGLIYGPSADFTLKASWGKSFKAPTLVQLFRSEGVLYAPVGILGGSGLPDGATALVLDGGSPDLKPERAQTWTASLAFHPNAVPGLKAELTWFDINYTDRVVQPIAVVAQALSDPAFSEFIKRNPTAAEQAGIISRDSDGIVQNIVGAPYDPSKVAAIVFFHFRNAAEQRVKGIDLSSSYRFNFDAGQLTLRGSASWLDSSQRVSITNVDLAGVLNNPPKLVGRAGAIWNQPGFMASAFANYKGGIVNPIDGVKSDSFTTFDVTMRYSFDRHERAWLPAMEIALSARNLLNRSPPILNASPTNYLVPPYDATNYSAFGRFIDVSVSVRW
jgi:outer membrane receptor protein involved in Fe transport